MRETRGGPRGGMGARAALCAGMALAVFEAMMAAAPSAQAQGGGAEPPAEPVARAPLVRQAPRVVIVAPDTADTIAVAIGDTVRFVAQGRDVLGRRVNDPRVAWTAYRPSRFTLLAAGVGFAVDTGDARLVVRWLRSDGLRPADTVLVRVRAGSAPVVVAGLRFAADTIRAGGATELRLALPDSAAADSLHWILPDGGAPTVYDAAAASLAADSTTLNRLNWAVASWQNPPCCGPREIDASWSNPVRGWRPGSQPFGVVVYRDGVERGRFFARLVVLDAAASDGQVTP